MQDDLWDAKASDELRTALPLLTETGQRFRYLTRSARTPSRSLPSCAKVAPASWWRNSLARTSRFEGGRFVCVLCAGGSSEKGRCLGWEGVEGWRKGFLGPCEW